MRQIVRFVCRISCASGNFVWSALYCVGEEQTEFCCTGEWFATYCVGAVPDSRAMGRLCKIEAEYPNDRRRTQAQIQGWG